MAVGYNQLPPLKGVNGIRIGVASAGIKVKGRDDLVVFELSDQCQTAAVFTQNAFCAAPVVVAKEHLQAQTPRYLIVNTGNANAGTGQRGIDAALLTCSTLAENCGCQSHQVLPFSTGVIGEQLPVNKIIHAIPKALENLSEDNWNAAATGIMTTDTVPKGVSEAITLDGKTVTITGISKGSGMIQPNMATMLAYVATDAAVDRATLQTLLSKAADKSFNRITVDGDTSTNDACVLMATGTSGVHIREQSKNYHDFEEALARVCQRLAHLIIRDGEGASKFVSITITSGSTEEECKQVAYAIAHSPLVKTALFASDPNWGRILAAIGRAGLENLDISGVEIKLGETVIVNHGGRAESYTEAAGQMEMSKDEIDISVNLGRGEASTTVWTCDFSYDYVRINAEYRT